MVVNLFVFVSVGKLGGVIFCYDSVYVFCDECGVFGFFFSVVWFFLIGGKDGKIDFVSFECGIWVVFFVFIYVGQFMVVMVIQLIEFGMFYFLEEIECIFGVVKSYNILLYMDGVCFVNVLIVFNVLFVEMIWKCGVDIFFFGVMKNGCWCVEVIVFMKLEQVCQFFFICKQLVQFFFKICFVVVQFEVYFEDGLWLEFVFYVNVMVDWLCVGIVVSINVCLVWKIIVNEVFVIICNDVVKWLWDVGVQFYDWYEIFEYFYDMMVLDEMFVCFVIVFVIEFFEVDWFVEFFW